MAFWYFSFWNADELVSLVLVLPLRRFVVFRGRGKTRLVLS